MRVYRLIILLMLLTFCISGASANTLSWQTMPILGTSVSNATGDVVVITGPTPTKPDGSFYTDVDGNIVLGPTIPHYSIVGDPLFGVGSPSMTQFYYNPNVCCDSSGHLYDPLVGVYSGSGINLDPLLTYHYKGVYTFTGTPGNPSYDIVAAENYAFGGYSFIMLMTGVSGFWPEDAGLWTYTETWQENVAGAQGDTIRATREFTVTAVPEPATLSLLGIGVAIIGVSRLRRRK
jgi:hypothetical protein